ncbi:MAG: phosphoglucosamine mutase [Candidatus Sericytochromatia bacterium]|nr:phosphoglucosamine mutase [Candidatus Sericytochromatia bacterium]
MARLFGTDGVRGLANRELTPERAFELGRAGAAYLRAQSQEAHPTVVVGKDTRRSGDMLEAALCAGICAVGVNVKRLGVLPTPGVAWLTRRLGAVAGVMISASHNPSPDNGIKFFGSNGFKLPDAVEDAIESLMNQPGEIPRPVGEALGRISEAHDLTARYLDDVAALLPAGLSGLKVVVDCGHGAAYALGPALLRRLGAEVIPLHTEPDGDNINRECGSTHLHFLQEAVVAAKADLGLAFDGDADRLLAVDHTGVSVDGDRLMLICLRHGVSTGRLASPSVVATVMSNMGFEDAIKAMGGEFVRAKVGDRYVLEEMLRRNIRLGGEQSGHLIFLDDNTTGDGLISALRVLEAVRASGRSLRDLAADMVSYPQLLHNLRVQHLAGWAENASIAAAVAEAEQELRGTGRILLRASGTEALLRLMVEGREQAQIEAIASRLAKVIYQELSPAPTVLA